MDKEEILKEIKKTEEHLATMRKLLEYCEYSRWKPKDFSPYFYVDSCMKIEQSDFYDDTYIHSERYNTYGTFKTREEAEQEAEIILIRRQLEDVARRLNKNEKIDWMNNEQPKYYFYLDNSDNELISDFIRLRQFQGVVYCLDRNFKDVAIKEIGTKRIMRYLRGK